MSEWATDPTPDDGPDAAALTAREAAARLGLDERTIRRAIARGELRATKLAGAFRITPAALDRFRALRSGAGRRPWNDSEDLPTPGGAMRRESFALLPLPVRPHLTPALPPVPFTSLVGRQRDLAATVQGLRRKEVRLLTLSGPGGVGKTRLALAAAAELADEFPDGVAFVGLASISDPELVAATIAHALGLREAGAEPIPVRLVSFLRERRLLLVLDNFEQVVEAAPLLTDLLAACPDAKVLVTSRVRLRVSGEHEREVRPLDLAERGQLEPVAVVERSAAVQLFVERARDAQADFALHPENASAVAEICRCLDGLPLAIELAAARVNVLPPAILLDHLIRRGATPNGYPAPWAPLSHLPLLDGGPRDLPARQQTLRDAIAWSHDLLDPAGQALFRRLGVFAGGFTVEAAQTVTGADGLDVLTGLAALVDQSLVRREPEAEVEPRFAMLETIRAYAAERLAEHCEAQAVGEAHAGLFLALAEAAESELGGPGQIAWLDRLETEHPNLRAAMAWYRDAGEVAQALRLAGALARFWQYRGHLSEGRAWLVELLEAADREDGVPLAIRAKAAGAAGTLAWAQSDLERAVAYHERALRDAEAAGDASGAAFALNNLGVQAKLRGDYGQATALFEDSLARADTAGDARVAAMARLNLGVLALDAADLERAERLLRTCLAELNHLGDRMLRGTTLANLGEVALRRGEAALAETTLAEALALFREMGERRYSAYVQGSLGLLVVRRGDAARGEALLTEALALSRDLGDRVSLAIGLERLAEAAGLSGDGARAARLLGTAAALREEIGAPPQLSERGDLVTMAAAARDDLGEEAFTAAWAAGRALAPEQAVAEALALHPALSEPSPPTASSQPATQDGLTGREREILRLLAAGLGNREIAERLFISPATAARHVANLFGKLGVDSRAKAIEVARRLELD